jgi:competence ComEA-like helix-hairpin-helix protein
MTTSVKKRRMLGRINGAQAVAALVEAGIPEAIASSIIDVRNRLLGRRFQSLEQLLNLLQSPQIKNWYNDFLPRCKEDRPVLLMPLRIETRVVGGELRIRFYPDDVLLKSHNPRLTPDEVSAGKVYLAAVSNGDSDAILDAWRTLSTRFGPYRAAWIAKAVESYDTDPGPESGEGAWTSETRIGPMPDQLAVYLYNVNGELAHRPIYQNYIIPDLQVIGGGGESGFFDQSSSWVHNYDQALANGMAISINRDELNLADESRLSRIVVVGLKRQTPDENQQNLEDLFNSHHYSNGMAFLRHGTATNNTSESKSGYSSAEDHEASYQIEVLDPPGWEEDTLTSRHNAERLGVALGLGSKPDVFKHLFSADDRSEDYAAAMNAALWPVLGQYFLQYMIPGTVDTEQLSAAGDHFSRFVRASGPLPILRIGRQPYGVLPVTRIDSADGTSDGWLPSDSDVPSRVNFDSGLHSVLSRLYPHWMNRAVDPSCVPRIGASDEPEQELLEILSMQPVVVDVIARPFVDVGFAILSLATIRRSVFGSSSPFDSGSNSSNLIEWVRRWREVYREECDRIIDLLQEITGLPGVRFKNDPAASMFGWWSTLDPGPFTTAPGETPDDYLSALCAGEVEGTSKALLRDLLKRALLLESETDGGDSRVREAICQLSSATVLDFFNTVTDANTIVNRIKDDPSRPPGPPRAYGVRPSLARRILEERSRLPDGRFKSLDQIDAIYGVGVDTFHDIIHAFKGSLVSADVDLLFRQNLELFSHRLDAWFTSFATKRLESMRSRNPSGVHIGAYGYLEDLDLSDATPTSEGYIHTPSSGQTATAAVLYSAFLTHETSESGMHPFHINFTSDRIKRGLRLLQGVREGQTLGALLGYQFERGLHVRTGILDEYIDEFREAFPTVANKLTEIDEGQAAENLAARNVIDGNALARSWRAIKGQDESPDMQKLMMKLQGILDTAETNDRNQIEAELDRLLDSLDAVGDLLLYESLYHAVAGNYDAAGAALDAGSGNGHPPEIASIKTRVNASVLDHRVIMFLPVADDPINICPRSLAEPILSNWFTAFLPSSLKQIGCSYSFTWRDEDGNEHAPIDINTAAPADLQTLPGIGEVKAEQIVTYRATYGSFQRMGDIIEIDDIDIGPTTFEKIRGRVWVGNPVVSFDQLDIEPIDLFYLASMPLQGEETQLEQRIHRIVRDRDAVLQEQHIVLDLTKPEGCAIGIDQIAEFARITFSFVSQNATLDPTSLALPAEADISHHSLEEANRLYFRVDAARIGLMDLRDRLSSLLPPQSQDGVEVTLTDMKRKAIDPILLGISRYGVQGAVSPGFDDPGLLRRARNVLKEVVRRTQEVVDITKPDPALEGPELDLYVQSCTEMLKFLFGREFIVLPTLEPASLPAIRESMSDADLLGQADTHRIRLWLQQEAEVHPALERLENWLLVAGAWSEAIAGPESIELGIAQLPHESGRRWLGLSDSERNGQQRDRDALSIVAIGAGLPELIGDSGTIRMAGLVIHRCQDRVPSGVANTSVGFHYDAPNAQAPQCLLLAVPARITDPVGAWTEDKLEAIVHDAMDLAKIRTVDLDALSIPEDNGESTARDRPAGLGGLIPSLFVPVDPAKLAWAPAMVADTVNQWLESNRRPR